MRLVILSLLALSLAACTPATPTAPPRRNVTEIPIVNITGPTLTAIAPTPTPTAIATRPPTGTPTPTSTPTRTATWTPTATRTRTSTATSTATTTNTPRPTFTPTSTPKPPRPSTFDGWWDELCYQVPQGKAGLVVPNYAGVHYLLVTVPGSKTVEIPPGGKALILLPIGQVTVNFFTLGTTANSNRVYNAESWWCYDYYGRR